MTSQLLPPRFLSKIEIDSQTNCWNWIASKYPNGYGQFVHGLNGRFKGIGAHRYAYELLVGPIPEGLQIDHLCRNRACVNPSHMEAVTQRVNLLRGETIAARQARQTQCVRGHPFNEVNTYSWKGHRKCRACGRACARARRQAKDSITQEARYGGDYETI